MSMDSSAIQKIIDLGQERNRIEVGAIPAAIISQNSKVESLEHLLENPIHHKVKFITSVFDDFVGYCKENCNVDQHSTIYIDQKAMCARAIFDHGYAADPQWGHHNANLILDKTPEFAALLANNNQLLSQQDFVDFLIDWEKFVKLTAEENAELPFQDAINRIRKLTVTSLSKAESEVGNFSANKSALESVEVSAGSTKPPAALLWSGVPYEGFSSRPFTAEIRAVVKGDSISLRYRIIQLESSINDIANEFRDHIKQALAEDSINIYLGTIQHRQ
jgi:uncharacterized protein YfdQ (DUF2303 family)